MNVVKSSLVQLFRGTVAGQDDDRRCVCMCLSTFQNESLLWTEENLENRERGNTSLCRPQLTSRENRFVAETVQLQLLPAEGVSWGSRNPPGLNMCVVGQLTGKHAVVYHVW